MELPVTVTSAMHEALLLLLQLAALAALALLQQWKAKAVEYYAHRTTKQQREWLALVGNEAFHYAEQVFLTYDGPAKLNEAVKYVLDRAKMHNLQVTYPEVRAVIEKAWAEFQTTKTAV